MKLWAEGVVLDETPGKVVCRILRRVSGKLFKSTLNNRLCSNLACVIDESSRGVKLKRAFEELPQVSLLRIRLLAAVVGTTLVNLKKQNGPATHLTLLHKGRL